MLSLILPQVNLSVGEAGRPLEATTGARLVLDFYPTLKIPLPSACLWLDPEGSACGLTTKSQEAGGLPP